jgi:hypothetical protein
MVRRLVVFSLSLSILPLGACSDERITGSQTGLHVVHPMSVITASAGDGTIAFARTDTQNDIWLMNPDGRGVRIPGKCCAGSLNRETQNAAIAADLQNSARGMLPSVALRHPAAIPLR